jgi:DNA-binding transcriptional MerR regulator
MDQGSSASLHEEGQKSSLAFRTISEVSQEIDVPQHVLRFWESRFTQIRPLKRGGGRRYYRPEDIELLRAIKNYLYKQGYTIKGVQRILKETRRSIGAQQAVQAYSRDTDLAQDVRPEDFSKDFGESFAASTAVEEIPTPPAEATVIERTLEAVETLHNEIENPPQPMRVETAEAVEAEVVEEAVAAAAPVEAIETVEAVEVVDVIEEVEVVEAAEAAPAIEPAPQEETVPQAALAELRGIHSELIALRDMLRGEAA